MTSSTAALETDKGNGSLSEYAINNGHSHSDRDVKTVSKKYIHLYLFVFSISLATIYM